MNAHAVLALVWIVAGVAAVAGSVLGGALGQRGLFLGAALGGVVGAVGGVWLCVRFGWLQRRHRTAACIGAVIGFLIATPIAASNLRSPLVPVLICSLAGVGALVGAGRAGGRSTPSR